MGDALSQTPYAQASPCRLPERRLLPTFALIIICFSILLFSLAKVVSRSPAVPGPPRVFYFSPSVPHYGGCALTDALCTGLSLPSSRASAPADFALIYFCFSFLHSLSRELSPEHRWCQGLRAFFISPPLSPIMGDALLQTPYAQAAPCRLPERRLLPTLAPSSRTCLLCWRPRGLHRATSDNCR